MHCDTLLLPTWQNHAQQMVSLQWTHLLAHLCEPQRKSRGRTRSEVVPSVRQRTCKAIYIPKYD